jgi:hypothetical protein
MTPPKLYVPDSDPIPLHPLNCKECGTYIGEGFLEIEEKEDLLNFTKIRIEANLAMGKDPLHSFTKEEIIQLKLCKNCLYKTMQLKKKTTNKSIPILVLGTVIILYFFYFLYGLFQRT